MFTSSKSNDDFGKKGQFSHLIVHVCLHESSRKGQQFGMTIEACADSYQQNKTVSQGNGHIFIWIAWHYTRSILEFFCHLWITLQKRRVGWEIFTIRKA